MPGERARHCWFHLGKPRLTNFDGRILLYRWRRQCHWFGWHEEIPTFGGTALTLPTSRPFILNAGLSAVLGCHLRPSRMATSVLSWNVSLFSYWLLSSLKVFQSRSSIEKSAYCLSKFVSLCTLRGFQPMSSLYSL